MHISELVRAYSIYLVHAKSPLQRIQQQLWTSQGVVLILQPCMLLRLQLPALLFAAMVGREASSRLKFRAEAGFFVDFVGLTRQDSAFRATTLPGLGLIDRTYDDGADQAESTTAGGGVGDPSFPSKPWVRFRDHVHALNARDPARTSYKILYITRHGFGYHNYYEAKVGTEAWDVRAAHLPN